MGGDFGFDDEGMGATLESVQMQSSLMQSSMAAPRRAQVMLSESSSPPMPGGVPMPGGAPPPSAPVSMAKSVRAPAPIPGGSAPVPAPKEPQQAEEPKKKDEIKDDWADDGDDFDVVPSQA